MVVFHSLLNVVGLLTWKLEKRIRYGDLRRMYGICVALRECIGSLNGKHCWLRMFYVHIVPLSIAASQ